MNGRTYQEKTPEARIAAAARSLMVKMAGFSNTPDYADFRDALGPYVELEIVQAKIQEAQLSSTMQRVKELMATRAELLALIREHPL